MRHTLDIKDLSSAYLMRDRSYYMDVFKKTEKIVSAVFFIIKDVPKAESAKDTLIDKLTEAGCDVLDEAAKTLLEQSGTAERALFLLMSRLTYLGGLLHAASAAQLIPAAYADLILGEIGVVLKNADRHQGTRIEERTEVPQARRREERQSAPHESSDRRSHIRELLKSKGHVSIKDISVFIPGVSEKSIQRDLKRMVLDGEVERKGERRWSIYSLVKDSVNSGGS